MTLHASILSFLMWEILSLKRCVTFSFIIFAGPKRPAAVPLAPQTNGLSKLIITKARGATGDAQKHSNYGEIKRSDVMENTLLETKRIPRHRFYYLKPVNVVNTERGHI